MRASKRVWYFGMGLYLAWLCGAAVAATAVVQGAVNANVRSGSSEHARIIRSLPPGTMLEVLQTGDSFTQVKAPDGTTGWVLNRLLKLDAGMTASPASAPVVANASPPVAVTELHKLQQELQAAQQEIRRLQAQAAPVPVKPVPTPVMDQLPVQLNPIVWLVLVLGAFVLGVLLGILWLEHRYRKKLHGLRI